MKEKQSAIPKATAKRPFSFIIVSLKDFMQKKIERANSKQIAEAIGIDSATVRRDFPTLVNLAAVDLATMSKN